MKSNGVSWWSSVLAAGLLGVLPACNRNTEPPSGAPVVGFTSDAAGDSAAGKPANLAFSMTDYTGKPVALSDFAGKPLLVNIWATWCAPCRHEIPWFIEFSEKYKEKGLTIVGVSYDDPPADIAAFVKELKVPYPMLVGLGHDDFFQAYDAESIYPVTWIIKPDGIVQAKAIGVKPREWFEQQIEATF